MVQFIFSNLLFISVGVVLYMVVRTLPRIDEAVPSSKTNILERWVTSEIPEKLDKVFNVFLLKFLRKTKVSVMKFGNLVDKELSRVKHEEDGGDTDKKITEFKAMREEKKEDKEA